MGNEVYANMREVSCKAADGKSICAFPDVCMTPPENPATPPGVPVPYPNTGMASDTTKGSRKVKITKKEVMLKNKSYFKKSMGDEAGCAAKKGVITSTNRGKVYFTSWSMDVKVEGANVVRMMDLTTHNHMSVPGNTPPWPYIDGIDAPDVKADVEDKCAEDMKKEKEACEDNGYGRNVGEGDSAECIGGVDPCKEANLTAKPGSREEAMAMTRRAAAHKCLEARKCMLVPYKPKNYKDGSKVQSGCCPGQTGHHIVEAGSFFAVGRGTSQKSKRQRINTEGDDGTPTPIDYNGDEAPCVCVSGKNQYHGSHGLMHSLQGNKNFHSGSKELVWVGSDEQGNQQQKAIVVNDYEVARDNGVAAMQETFPDSKCDERCTKAQIDAFHNQHGIDDDTKVRSIVTGYTSDTQAANARDIIKKDASKQRYTRSHINLNPDGSKA